jgi:energy-coupling factor transport system permease protein
MAFEPLARRTSLIYALDPRVKLAFALTCVTLVFLLPSIVMGLAVTALCLLYLAAAGVPGSRTARYLRTTAPLLVAVLVLSSIFGGESGPVLFNLGPLEVTRGDLGRAVLLASRLLALSLAAYAWLATTDQADMVRGFNALGVPYNWGLTAALALRFLPLLAGLFGQVREAQEARGLDLQAGGFRKRLDAYRPILIATMIGALRIGERLGWALESRALGAPGVRRTTYRPLQMHPRDWLALALLGALIAAAILLRVL